MNFFLEYQYKNKKEIASKKHENYFGCFIRLLVMVVVKVMASGVVVRWGCWEWVAKATFCGIGYPQGAL